jgi:predicted secreted protein
MALYKLACGLFLLLLVGGIIGVSICATKEGHCGITSNNGPTPSAKAVLEMANATAKTIASRKHKVHNNEAASSFTVGIIGAGLWWVAALLVGTGVASGIA